LDGVFKFRIQKTYEQSTVAKILELVEHAQNKKTNTENFIKKFATIYTPIVVLIAVLFVFCGTFIFNFAFSDVLKRALTFLVISCPCALVISIPLSFFAGIGKASQEGVLIKGSSYIETLTKIKEAVFDKTGTLTKGKFEVSEINSENPDILKFAAFAEASSNHPIAIAIKEKWGKDIPVNTSIKEIAGSGVTSQIEGVEVKLGKANFVGVEPIETDGTVVYVSLNGEYVGNLVVKDSVKATSKDAISELKDLKIHTTMLTGDTKNVALTVQKELEIDDIYFEQTPQNKVENLEKIMSKTNGKTLFVGDGVNDAPVIMRADIGISMGGMGSDSAIEASDIVIMNDNLLSIVKAINISKKTLNITKQNIIFAIGIKILFLLLGSFGLMTIWGAVFADVGVTMLTICNSLRIFR
jgi:Cd2+/Zn2+-exporting ATPase